jgi:hypothetical protein
MGTARPARDVAEELLNLTRGLELSGDNASAEQDIEAYERLIDERGPLLDELTRFSEQGGAADSEKQAVGAILAEVARLEKEHLQKVEIIKQYVLSSAKEAKGGRALTSAYVNPPAGGQVSGYLDIKH